MPRTREVPSTEHGALNQYYDLDTRTVRDAVLSLGPRLGGRLLEVGCGAAPYRAFLELFVRQYIASDYHGATGHQDVVCDGARLGFRSESFDSVLCTQVLEHVRDPQGVLQEICRVLRATVSPL